jgi:hypothetical protein
MPLYHGYVLSERRHPTGYGDAYFLTAEDAEAAEMINTGMD